MYSKLFSITLLGIYFYFIAKLVLYHRRSNYTIENDGNVGNGVIDRLNNKLLSPMFGDYWNPAGIDWIGKSSKQYSEKWNSLTTEIKKIMKDSNIEPNLNYQNKAVIHFRCCDSPFNKHPEYPMLTKEYFLFALKKIEESNVNEILILNCSNWNSKFIENAEEKCNSYISVLCDWLEENTEIKINRQKICISIKETYSIMLGSKILIGTGGSFSFIPGMLKGKNFISPQNVGEKINVNKKILKDLSKNVHWTMWDKLDHLPHKNIDYNNFDYKDYDKYSVKINLI